MKIAIPDNNGEVNQHFGQSRSFSLIEIDNSNHVIDINTVSTAGLQHMHEGIADFLKNQGVEIVIVGGIGKGAIDGLESRGLKVLFGASGLVKDTAEAFAEGRFVSKRTVCSHQGENHHHGNRCSH
ncbi:NifB/NifX family molybdenum-iron cluster-binding protein [Phosphitispora sp. TUW77]|uniref:NifB/NifX family molybdenum-iron cluster-binding protein n=1 Tax=Phosphitispora sp. TUW77 TaxID=3152361 RepID=UPI003AB24FFC